MAGRRRFEGNFEEWYTTILNFYKSGEATGWQWHGGYYCVKPELVQCQGNFAGVEAV